MKSVRKIQLRGRTVFLRVDLNVPLNDKLEITEDGRIKAALTTIEYLVQQGAKIVIGAHLGRPHGKVVEEMRLIPVAKRLGELLGQEVFYMDDCIGEEVERKKAELQDGEVMLLENLRFYPQEMENDLHFSEQLAKGIDVYITDAFGVIHRKHASLYGLPSLVFDKGIGFLMEEEVAALNRVIRNPEEPLVVLIGGIKISDKVDVIRNLAPVAACVMVGGGVANALLKGLGYDIGGSIVESDSVSSDQQGVDYSKMALEIWRRFESEEGRLELTYPDGKPLGRIVHPVDFVAAPSVEEGAETKIIELGDDVPKGWMFLDIGPKTRELYAKIFAEAGTAFWNGPLGVFEMEAYAEGSRIVAQAIADSEGYSVIGGGDTEVVVDMFGLKGHVSHLSTGGGASLAFLAQHELPGLAALD